MQKLSHVGIAVSDLEKAISDYENVLSFDVTEVSEVPQENVKVAFLKFGDSEIELLSPKGEGTIQRFIETRGEGLHHIAIKVEDVSKAIADAKAAGLHVLDDIPRKGSRGAEAAFVHPKSFHGVLLEFYSM